MTEEQIRIKVAEACGWKDIRDRAISHNLNGRFWKTIHKFGTSPQGLQNYLPNYTQSLDACREFDDKLKGCKDRESYCVTLCKVVHGMDHLNVDVVLATPLQRCEAFLRMRGLWGDGE